MGGTKEKKKEDKNEGMILSKTRHTHIYTYLQQLAEERVGSQTEYGNRDSDTLEPLALVGDWTQSECPRLSQRTLTPSLMGVYDYRLQYPRE